MKRYSLGCFITLLVLTLTYTVIFCIVNWPAGKADKTTDDRLSTTEHDGHKFILSNWHPTGHFIHHPDCPCQKAKENP